MTAALEFLGDFQGFAVAAAEARDDQIVRAAKQCHEDWKTRGLLFQQLVDDKVVIADDRFDKADGRTDFRHVRLAPIEAERILVGRPPGAAAFRAAAEASLRGASPRAHNAFKVELAKRAIVRALSEAAGAS